MGIDPWGNERLEFDSVIGEVAHDISEDAGGGDDPDPVGRSVSSAAGTGADQKQSGGARDPSSQ